MSENPYVFIVGCARSGTTLLRRMLDHHHQLVVAEDSHFIPKCLKHRRSLVGDPALTRDLIDCARTYRRFQKMGLGDSAVARAASQASTYGQFVSGLYDELAAANGKPLAGQKTPDYVRYITVLDRLFPRVRFVHIIRDGRDVALSVLEWARSGRGPARFPLWDENPVAVCALWWQWMVTQGRRDGASLGTGRYFEVRYETLVARPQEELGDILSFLDLPFSEEALHYYRGRMRSEPGRDAKSAWLPPTPGLRDWRTQMPPHDVELFEAIAGDLVVELGYERAYPRIGQEIATEADRCRSWWETRRVTRRPSRRSEVAHEDRPQPR